MTQSFGSCAKLGCMSPNAGMNQTIAGLRSRAKALRFGKHSLLVASPADIIASKTAAARPQDLAVLPVLNKTFKLQEKQR